MALRLEVLGREAALSCLPPLCDGKPRTAPHPLRPRRPGPRLPVIERATLFIPRRADWHSQQSRSLGLAADSAAGSGEGVSRRPSGAYWLPWTGITGHSNSLTGVMPIVIQPFAAYHATCSSLVNCTGVVFHVRGNTIQRPPRKPG